MKFNIEVDCTPEEVRRLIGLPDLTPVHDVYLDRVKETMAQGITPDVVENMVRAWVPGAGTGVDLMKDLLGAFTGGATSGAPGGKGKKS